MKTRRIIPLVVLILAITAAACTSLPFTAGTESASPSPLPEKELPEQTEDAPSPAEPTPTSAETDPSDQALTCGDDPDCFYTAAENCQKAQYLHDTSLSLMGMEILSRTHFSLRGEEEGRCVFEVVTEEVSVDLSEEAREQMLASGSTEEDIQVQLDAVRSQQLEAGFDEVCRGQGSDLAAMVKRWESGQMATADWEPFQCEGKIFSAGGVSVSTPAPSPMGADLPENQLVNPSFEQNPQEDPLRWSSSGTEGGILAAWGSGQAHHGLYSLMLQGVQMGSSGFPDWYTREVLPIEPGQSYRFSVWMMSPEGGSGLISVDLLDDQKGYLLGHAVGCVEVEPGTWQEITAEISSEETSQAAFVRFHLRLCLPQEGEEVQTMYFDQLTFRKAAP